MPKHITIAKCDTLTELEATDPLHQKFDTNPEWMGEFLAKNERTHVMCVGEDGHGFVPISEMVHHMYYMEFGYIYSMVGGQLYRLTIHKE